MRRLPLRISSLALATPRVNGSAAHRFDAFFDPASRQGVKYPRLVASVRSSRWPRRRGACHGGFRGANSSKKSATGVPVPCWPRQRLTAAFVPMSCASMSQLPTAKQSRWQGCGCTVSLAAPRLSRIRQRLRMNELISTLGVALAVFISTNIDNFFVLSVLFADRYLRPRFVVIGCFLAFALVGALSVAIGLGATALPKGYVSILGVLPLALGVQRLTVLRRAPRTDDAAGDTAEPIGLLTPRSRLQQKPYSQVLAVAGVGLANSGDNLAAYVTLFAHSPAAIPVYLLSFATLTAVWCVAGYRLASHRVVRVAVRRAGRVAFPIV